MTRAVPGRRLVLAYHGVGWREPEADPHNLFVPAHALRAQLTRLLRQGWRPLSLADYLDGRPGGRAFLVTFDDGYRSVVDVAMPLLADLGVPAVVFVCAGLLGGSSRWMADMPDEPLVTAEEVRELRSGGIEVCPHGLDHRPLAGLAAGELLHQTAGAANLLAAVTGTYPRAFAYPYGSHDAAARAAVARAGMQVGFATHAAAGQLAVPRIDVNATDTDLTFRLKTRRGYRSLRTAAGLVPGLRPMLHAAVGTAARDHPEHPPPQPVA